MGAARRTAGRATRSTRASSARPATSTGTSTATTSSTPAHCRRWATHTPRARSGSSDGFRRSKSTAASGRSCPRKSGPRPIGLCATRSRSRRHSGPPSIGRRSVRSRKSSATPSTTSSGSDCGSWRACSRRSFISDWARIACTRARRPYQSGTRSSRSSSRRETLHVSRLSRRERREADRKRLRKEFERHQVLGWQALKKADVAEARKQAFEALRRAKLGLESWRLVYCALRGR